ncbi:MAG: thioredoxin family protein [Verrucomicrobiota bacterium]
MTRKTPRSFYVIALAAGTIGFGEFFIWLPSATSQVNPAFADQTGATNPVATPVAPEPDRRGPFAAFRNPRGGVFNFFKRASPGANTTAAPVAPSNPGISLSSMRADSQVVENFAPERVPVYPDDPQSAWWEINPHYAFARAQLEQKPMLLLFTGIWNSQAMSLSEEVFSTKSFNEYAKENLIICYLNYPRSITSAAPVLRDLKERFKVMGYPNVIFFNPNGDVERGIRGYRSGRPIDYFEELKSICRPILADVQAQKMVYAKRGFRTWTNFLGDTIFARFVEQDTLHVTLIDVRGNRWTLPINDLFPEDQLMVESFPAVPFIEPPKEEDQ